MAYAPPNERKIAYNARMAALVEQQQDEIAACYQQYLTPQERASRDAKRLARGLPLNRRGRR